MNEEVFHAVGEALQRGEPAALVTIIRTQGSTPQRVGAKMVVFADGRLVGTIGGGCYENDAFWKARQSLRTRKPEVVRYELSDDIAEESGLICGGQMEVYIEPIEAAPHLYLVGAGHVAYHLARVAASAGFHIHVLDDREKFASADRFPEAVEIARWIQFRPGSHGRASPPAPTSSSSPAATAMTWTPCGRWFRASSATFGLNRQVAPRWRAPARSAAGGGSVQRTAAGGPRTDRPGHRARSPPQGESPSAFWPSSSR